MKRYILITKPGCPFCVAAEKALSESGRQHNVIEFEPGQENLLSEFKEAYDWRTVPMIFSRDGNEIKFIGGYTDLEGYLAADG